MYSFHKKCGYRLRSRSKAQISRIKQGIGLRLLTRKSKSQELEGVVITNLANLWNSFGSPISVRII
ncbi:hypothetical protein DM82_5334 [Burkholderia oklahomensis]|uniref:Transposase n=1 Tax=Burkholderia oklahomensis TaxID=342113 RepID=A0AAI8FQZ6_9BURK|nr:hypothetical protein [Burkholderia oklahomensis]AOI39252.1 transposase [Burkholderia oklahomensis EO147]AIO70201.1 hypothetical protein DM82_5334 [Burkholderia oklahomensis]AJX33818.1 transposase domain protein [Burkholderia oklahomensis C6786]AOI48941.1 transposase [Burkholderia oklahomensis C6786]KUY50459.1 transposase [Burkholderia oklahomensis C6786]